ncbi:Sybindin-like protein [Violaceomyces palustris]|uniref:Sybindin-like protein n=1 Tax=Violaceomyces palustris TaxID=1673888 RepID=A0ACD0NWK0_9BASI|nr:Sybindin-like protein [Violaceomyces palustris]
MSSLWIINKAGGLIYQAEHFTHPDPSVGRLSSNEYLVLAGTLHGIHAITSKLSPLQQHSKVNDTGLESLEADGFSLRVMVTLTGEFKREGEACSSSNLSLPSSSLPLPGTKFVLLTQPSHPRQATILQKCYEIYSDLVMKNPFYTSEMPIRVEAFDRAIESLLKR